MTAVDLIKKFEGCRLSAYQDEGGIWTVGYGCTGRDIGPDTVWTQEKADQELLVRVGKVQDAVIHLVTAYVSPSQIAALTSLAYNIGINAFARSTTLRELNAGDIEKAADAFLLWDHVGGHVSKGLDSRRTQERKVFLEGASCT